MSVIKTAEGAPRAWLRLAAFYAAALVALLVVMVILHLLAPRVPGNAGPHPGGVGRLDPWTLAFYGVFFAGALATVSVLTRRLLDKKPPLSSLGLRFRAAPAGLAAGFGWGAALLAVTCGVMALAGGAEMSWSPAPALTPAAGAFAFFGLFAATEELFLRGYPITVLDESWTRLAAVAATSLAFALLHGLNPGMGVLSFVNIALAGVIMALLYLRSGSLWLAIGFHWGWNFAEGTVFGFAVSGIRFGGHLLTTTPAGPPVLSGGGFGPEGSAALTAAAAALLALILWNRLPYPGRRAASAPGGN